MSNIIKKDIDLFSEAVSAKAMEFMAIAISNVASSFDFKKKGELEVAKRAIIKEGSNK